MFNGNGYWTSLKITSVAITVALLTSVPSCFSPATGYRLVTQKNGIAHFSFECPAQYSSFNLNSELQYLTYSSSRRYSGVPIASIIDVTISEPGFFARDVQSLVQHRIDVERGQIDFEILELNDLYLGEVQARQLVYSYATPSGDILARGIIHLVVFNVNNLLWEIRMVSDSSMEASDTFDYLHLLETFKILD